MKNEEDIMVNNLINQPNTSSTLHLGKKSVELQKNVNKLNTLEAVPHNKTQNKTTFKS